MLKAKMQTPTEMFSDGIATVLTAKNGVILSNAFSSIRYGIRTVGAIRFFQAKTAGTEIDMLISVPFNYLIKQNDLIELQSFHTGQKEIYEIKQLQVKDTIPKSLHLTLVRSSINYVDYRTND